MPEERYGSVMIEEIERLRANLKHEFAVNSHLSDVKETLRLERDALRTELAKARDAMAYAIGPTRDVKVTMLREAIRSIDESGVLK